jgi:hypothetical protein
MTPMQSIHRIFAVATLAATVLLSPALHAQVSTHTSEVNVPFAFNCGSQHFGAGTYRITMTETNFLIVSNQEQSGSLVFESDSQPGGSDAGYLVFRKYGNRYFLGEYHPASGQISARILRSKTERRAERDYAANRADAGHVRLALLENGRAVSSER